MDNDAFLGVGMLVAGGLTLVIAGRSRRGLFSLAMGATLSGLCLLIDGKLRWVAGIFCGPGILTSWFMFGPHSSGPSVYPAVINMIFYGMVTYVFLKVLPSDERGGWWPTPKD
jgi:hypothetical protein